MKTAELVAKLEQSREAFLQAVEGLAEEAMLEAGVVGEWSVKDILVHLMIWEAELVTFLWKTREGVRPATVHTQRDLDMDAQNARWYEEHKDRLLDRAWQDFHGVRRQTMRRVEAFTDEELNDPQRHAWLRGKPLWEWVASDSFEHEAEHAAQIRAWRERRGL
ncbi:MAG TPA: ClbS/DfsB family four-helix bundle protein [Anaerolineales bacterium]|nr:ClbS/DfsB family four-helix bundle protein [Anaerolineales bacterium]